MREATLAELREAISNLKEARDLIATPGVWIKGALAKDAMGYPYGSSIGRPFDHDDAIQVCSLGALWKVRRQPRQKPIQETLAVQFLGCAAVQFLGCAMARDPFPEEDKNGKAAGFAVVSLNDATHTTQSDVLAGFDLAIELAEKTLNSIPDKLAREAAKKSK